MFLKQRGCLPVSVEQGKESQKTKDVSTDKCRFSYIGIKGVSVFICHPSAIPIISHMNFCMQSQFLWILTDRFSPSPVKRLCLISYSYPGIGTTKVTI